MPIDFLFFFLASHCCNSLNFLGDIFKCCVVGKTNLEDKRAVKESAQDCPVLAEGRALPAAVHLNVGSERKSIQCTGLCRRDPQRK